MFHGTLFSTIWTIEALAWLGTCSHHRVRPLPRLSSQLGAGDTHLFTASDARSSTPCSRHQGAGYEIASAHSIPYLRSNSPTQSSPPPPPRGLTAAGTARRPDRRHNLPQPDHRQPLPQRSRDEGAQKGHQPPFARGAPVSTTGWRRNVAHPWGLGCCGTDSGGSDPCEGFKPSQGWTPTAPRDPPGQT